MKEATPQSGWEKARLLWTICVPPREILGGIFIWVDNDGRTTSA
ncbi:hypothetical protein [Selenomonas artemidis]|nr:hypothetical protein [Selenomonas artemidis]